MSTSKELTNIQPSYLAGALVGLPPHSIVFLTFSCKSDKNEQISPNQKQPYTQSTHIIPNSFCKKKERKKAPKKLILGTVLGAQGQWSSKNVLDEFTETYLSFKVIS